MCSACTQGTRIIRPPSGAENPSGGLAGDVSQTVAVAAAGMTAHVYSGR
jgi:hypothetical protein